MNLRSEAKSAVKSLSRSARRMILPERDVTSWADLLRRERPLWDERRRAAIGGPKILIATGTGGHPAVTPVESMLAVALSLRGADVRVLLCDEFLPACLQATREEFLFISSFARRGPKALCGSCLRTGLATFGSLGLPILRYSDLVSSVEKGVAQDISATMPPGDIATYREGRVSIGEHALAGSLRFFGKGALQDERLGEAVLRRYLFASLLTVRAANRLLDSDSYASLVFHHGIYVPQGLIGEVARSRDVPVVNWNPAYRKRCFVFSHGDTYHHTLMHEPTSAWENLAWTPELEDRLMAYLKSRRDGSQDWIWFHERPNTDIPAIREELGIDPARPLIGMLTNVVWDAQLHYPANAFPSMIDWTLRTIRYFEGRPDLQLVIRAHPAEITGGVPSRQLVTDVIKHAFPRLPENVMVIPPQSRISTYAVMSLCDSAIIYGTKTGVELTSLGMPVIVAGEAWIRNKEISLDASSIEEYFRLLDRLPFGKRLDDLTQRRARKYAYHFFFRRMIPLSFMQPQRGWPPYRVQVNSLQELLPGCDRGLDVICEGILSGSSFIYPDEEKLGGD